jgi:uncharacterized protein (DUF58 family)
MLARLIPPLATPPRGEAMLRRRELYMLPNRHGLVFAIVLLVLLLTSINYENGLAYAFTFLMASVAVISMLYTHRNLFRLRIAAGSCDPVFTGENAQFSLSLTNDSNTPRFGVCLEQDGQVRSRMDIGPGETQRIQLPVLAKTRGYLNIPDVLVSTTYPLCILYSWSRRLLLGQRCLVYPRPASTRPLQPAAADGEFSALRSARTGDDFAGIREYRPGDSPRHIDWRAVARGQPWHVKQFGGSGHHTLMFDWDTLEGDLPETRLSVLCRWILDAERQGAHYGLRLPGNTIETGQGEAHQHRCLAALALFPSST